jgi:hypothetical protein
MSASAQGEKVTTRQACNEPRHRDGNPRGGHASDQAIVVGQGRRRHPATTGQIPGMTLCGGQAIQESQRAPSDGANPASQPQASHG